MYFFLFFLHYHYYRYCYWCYFIRPLCQTYITRNASTTRRRHDTDLDAILTLHRDTYRRVVNKYDSFFPLRSISTHGSTARLVIVSFFFLSIIFFFLLFLTACVSTITSHVVEHAVFLICIYFLVLTPGT